MHQRRLRAANPVGQAAITLGRLGLPAQRRRLGFQAADHIVQPQHIGFGRAQPDFRFSAAHCQAGNAGGFFQQLPAFGGTGGDNGADAALANNGRAVSARGRIGKQQPHILRAGIAAIQPIVRTGTAIDAALDFQFLAGAASQLQGDAGKLAGWPRGGACKNHIVHAARTHRFGAGFAHHPAQRLEEIGFAATIGANHTGQARLDQQISWLDKRLEAGKAKAAKFQLWALPQRCLQFNFQIAPFEHALLNRAVDDEAGCAGQLVFVHGLIAQIIHRLGLRGIA